MFCYPEHIDAEMDRIFAALAAEQHLCGLTKIQFVNRAAYNLSEINAVHAFREGNGRTQLLFTSIVAERAEHPFDARKINPRSMLRSMIVSYAGSLRPLKQAIAKIVSTSPTDRGG